jgi:hypothetical protein
MKDPIVQEIHRHRTEHAKRFNYDVSAIGDDIRRSRASPSTTRLIGWRRHEVENRQFEAILRANG